MSSLPHAQSATRLFDPAGNYVVVLQKGGLMRRIGAKKAAALIVPMDAALFKRVFDDHSTTEDKGAHPFNCCAEI